MGETTHDLTCGLSLPWSAPFPGAGCFDFSVIIQLFETKSFNKFPCFSIVDCSLFESVPLGGAGKGSGFNGHFASSMRRQQKLNESSNVSKDHQRGAKGSKPPEDASKIFESGSGTSDGLEAEKDYNGLFLDFDDNYQAVIKGKQESPWTRTTRVVDD